MFRHVILLLSVAFAASVSAAEVQPVPAQSAPKTSRAMALKAGDRLVVLGGTFAERLVASGYFETLLVSRQPKLRLSLRSLAWPADEVTRKEFQFELIRYMNGRKGWADGGKVLLQPRPRDFGDVFTHLGRQRPTVLLLCFGFNESFRGQAGLKDFRRDLARFVKDLRQGGQPGQQAADKKLSRRLVLVSPIAHESISPLAVEPAQRNLQLKLYSDAIGEVAAEAGVHFVDLFSATRPLAQSGSSRLTFNGVHLTEYGNWLVARFLASSIGVSEPAWEVKLDRDSGRITARGTRVVDVRGDGKRLSFATSDNRLPLPPPPADGAPPPSRGPPPSESGSGGG